MATSVVILIVDPCACVHELIGQQGGLSHNVVDLVVEITLDAIGDRWQGDRGIEVLGCEARRIADLEHGIEVTSNRHGGKRPSYGQPARPSHQFLHLISFL
jgi:hypothetical protein